MNKVKLAVIGLGYWGPNLIRNINELENAEIKYGCDLRFDLIKKYSLAYPNITFISDYNRVLKDKNIDAVCIATPLSTHYKLAKLALNAGKHVLLEKPMVSSVEKGEELIKLARKKNAILMVDYTFLFTGAVSKIKALIDNNELGKIYYFDSERINLGLIRQDNNVIWDLAAHDLSIILYLFDKNKPLSVFATATKHLNEKVEEMAHITLELEGGIVAHIHVSWLSPVKIRKILIGGSKKMIVYNDIEPSEKVKVYNKGIDISREKVTPFNPAYRSGDIYIPKLDNTEALKLAAEHFVKCIQKKKKSLMDGDKVLMVVKLLESCDKSIAKGKKIKL